MGKDETLKQTETNEESQIDVLFGRILGLIEQARRRLVTATNIAEMYTNIILASILFKMNSRVKDVQDMASRFSKSCRLVCLYGIVRVGYILTYVRYDNFIWFMVT